MYDHVLMISQTPYILTVVFKTLVCGQQKPGFQIPSFEHSFVTKKPKFQINLFYACLCNHDLEQRLK